MTQSPSPRCHSPGSRTGARQFRRLRPLASVLLPLLLIGCSSGRYFAPRENQNGTGPQGSPAAVYPLTEPDGEVVGELRLWSEGAQRHREGSAETTRLHLGFELENLGSEPLLLGPGDILVQAVRPAADGDAPAVSEPLRPVATTAVAEASPGQRATLELQFDLGAERGPRSIDGFDVAWTVRRGERAFRQLTPFVHWVPEPRALTYDDWFITRPYWRRCYW